ncbi:hypothetical protein [Loigolactobacillus zhaoyuanensis]|uniref:Uncharacterized protein n=1 Tax=Loigolactobacillus zhaoyuanensis TaxID=2486017 RepID=A0ABW8UKD0_9LACO|nr:hypothetical protein [Loigolactobacillus zhaoyuanensis]
MYTLEPQLFSGERAPATKDIATKINTHLTPLAFSFTTASTAASTLILTKAQVALRDERGDTFLQVGWDDVGSVQLGYLRAGNLAADTTALWLFFVFMIGGRPYYIVSRDFQTLPQLIAVLMAHDADLVDPLNLLPQVLAAAKPLTPQFVAELLAAYPQAIQGSDFPTNARCLAE